MKPETKEIAIFDVKKFSIAQLPELKKNKKKEIADIIKANPIVAIIDAETYDQAKKSRTAVKTLRTSTEKEQGNVKKEVKLLVLDAIDKEYNSIISDIKLEEQKRQDIVTSYETKKEAEKQAKALAEQQRIDNIKKVLENYSTEWKANFNNMVFDTIKSIGADFVESYTNFDSTVLQEFETLFPSKVEELNTYLLEKTGILTEKENSRIEQERKDLELKRTRELITAGFSFDGNNYFVSDFKRLDMGTILSLSDEDFESIINAGKVELSRLAKIESDKLEKLEEEKEAIYEIRKNRLLELGLKYSDEHDTIYVDADSDFILLCSEIKEESAIEFEKTITESKQAFQYFFAEPIPEVLEAVIITETLQPEKVEVAEVVKPEISTVNVCTSLPQDALEIEHTVDAYSNVPETPISYDLPKHNWKTIQEEFKASGEKSYSVWLEKNYNVPTKL